MYGEISPQAQKRYPLAEFTDEYGRAQETATVASVTTGEPTAAESEGRPAAVVPVSLETHAFGQIDGRLVLPLAGDRVAWSPNPGLPGPGARRAPRAAFTGARAGPDPGARRDPTGGGAVGKPVLPTGIAAQHIAGEIASPTPKRGREPHGWASRRARRRGERARARVRPAARRTAGRRAGGGRRRRRPTRGRVLAEGKPVPGKPVHATIDPGLQQAAVAALGGSYGGVAVLNARDGSVLALAGIAFSGPQPPGRRSR